MDKKFFLFDLDGTIIEPKEGITKSVQYSLKSFDIHVDNLDSLTSFIGPPLRDSYKKYFGFNNEETENAVIKYREYFSIKGIYENTLYQGIEELLHKLWQNGKTLIIATSKVTVFAERIIKHYNLDKYFSFIAGSEMDGNRSKKGEVIKYALENAKIINLNEAVMIGDRKHDIIGANETGLESIGVLYGYGDMEELKNAGATYIVKDIDKLSKLLLRPQVNLIE